MSWRLAQSLERLRAQLNTAYPNRSKVSDGSVGDLSHQQRPSDHNPDSKGRVCAIDVTHDPAHGLDGKTLSRQSISDPRVKYVIFSGQIWKARTGKWEPYRGANAHNHHVHISVKPETADDLSPWTLGDAPQPKPAKPVLKLGSKGPEVKELQTKLHVTPDGDFGYGTERAVKRFQLAHGLKDDGIVGAASWAALDEQEQ